MNANKNSRQAHDSKTIAQSNAELVKKAYPLKFKKGTIGYDVNKEAKSYFDMYVFFLGEPEFKESAESLALALSDILTGKWKWEMIEKDLRAMIADFKKLQAEDNQPASKEF